MLGREGPPSGQTKRRGYRRAATLNDVGQRCDAHNYDRRVPRVPTPRAEFRYGRRYESQLRRLEGGQSRLADGGGSDQEMVGDYYGGVG